MQIRPIGGNDIPFLYKKENKVGMVYEPKENPLLPPKLKAIIIIPKENIEVNEDDRTNN